MALTFHEKLWVGNAVEIFLFEREISTASTYHHVVTFALVCINEIKIYNLYKL